MTALVFLEHHDGDLARGGLGVLARAKALGLDVAGVVLGHDVAGVAAAAGASGVEKIFVVDDAVLATPAPAAPRGRDGGRGRAERRGHGPVRRLGARPPMSRPGSPRGSRRASTGISSISSCRATS